MERLKGKIALVTGGSSGIGFATAKLFANEGAFVFLTGRRPAELAEAVASIGSNAVGVEGDISNLADLDRLFLQIETEAGRLDIVFANAGIGEFLPLGSITEEHFERTFATNVRGTLFTVQKALPLMPRGASIVLNGSMVASKGVPAFSVYSASKAALRSFARGWAVDLKGRGIRVNVVSPGAVPTPAYLGFGMTAEQLDSFIAANGEATPLGRVGTPEEIAEAVLFLASESSSYVNGSDLSVDGGQGQI